MIRIAITDGVRGDLSDAPLGSVGYESEANERGERLIWLDRAVVDRLALAARAGRELQRRNPADRG